jgi:hypothetical protein
MPFFIIVSGLVGMLVFVPTLLIAMTLLKSPRRAFVLAATFSIGGMIGLLLGLVSGNPLIRPHGEESGLPYLALFAGLAGIAGGLLAVYVLGRLAGQSLWRRE